MGGDAFALVCNGGSLHGLNASGQAPMAANAEELLSKGMKEVPLYGFYPVTIPGVPAAWQELSGRFGRLPFLKVLEPAIEYADNGFPVSPSVATLWRLAYQKYSQVLKGEMFHEWFRVFALDGKTPVAGGFWRSPNHADTLRKIGQFGSDVFYNGEFADKIDAFSRAYGGWIRKSDLEAFAAQWITPISVGYRGFDVWEIPPNGQGIVALMALNILNKFDFEEWHSIDRCHKQIEALKLALVDGLEFIADPLSMEIPLEYMVSEEYSDFRRGYIGKEALLPKPRLASRGGTVYLATADGEGNMVSMIQSNYRGFGSGLVVPGTGIALHNRGCNFHLDPARPNCLRPGQRPYHTIIPGFITKKGRPIGPFGVMGAFMQPQGHLQVIMNMLDFKMNPQTALDAPRWQWIGGRKVLVENNYPRDLVAGLLERRHDVEVCPANADCDVTGSFGRGQIIVRLENGAYMGATEPRADGHAAPW
jgi:gamma-glutamyltranspeptidase/glutathione hydrolase